MEVGGVMVSVSAFGIVCKAALLLPLVNTCSMVVACVRPVRQGEKIKYWAAVGATQG
jgi:hypothetical protein